MLKFPRIAWVMAAAAVAARLFYWVYADRVWEDSLITILHAVNAVEGIGLTHYRPGEMPIHGFTSPLSVLIPLAGEVIHRGWGLGAIRLVSLLCGGVSVLLAFRFGLSTPFACLWAALLAFSHDQVHWGIAGMETQIATTSLIWSMSLLREDRGKWIEGLAFALCMYARPDFAPWAGIACLFRRRAFLPTALIYLPWVIFTTLYYGSPIPNTILAKSAGYAFWWEHKPTLQAAWDYIYNVITIKLYLPLGPTWAGHGAGGFQFLWEAGWISKAMLGFALVGFARWRREFMPAYAMVAVYTAYYVFLVPTVFTWYAIPLSAIMGLIAAHGAAGVLSPRIGAVAAAAYALCFVYTWELTFPGERAIQTYIENGVRRKMGEDLGRILTPQDSVVCEPLGYTSFYSRRVIYDYPGLCSRKVVQFFREHPERRGLIGIAEAFRAPYLLVRQRELEEFQGRPDEEFLKEYTVIREYRLAKEDYAKIPMVHLNVDTDFLLMKRTGEFVPQLILR